MGKETAIGKTGFLVGKMVSIDLMGHLCLVPDPRQRKGKNS